MLNETMDEVVLVKGWKKGANWSFPRGKIDKDEQDLKCAVREVYEETGYDLKEAGLVGEEQDMKYIDVEIRGQDIKLYVFRGVPMETYFEPRTRKEISKISWHKLSELPTVKKRKQLQEGHGEELAVNANKFYMVAPFLGPLKKWINQQRKRDKGTQSSQAKGTTNPDVASIENAVLEQEALEEQINDERAEQDHLARLLHTLQQSSQAMTRNLPEVAHPERPQQAKELKQPPKSADLLALLRNGSENASQPKPQTPFDQIIGQASMPGPPMHQGPSQLIPTSPPPPIFPTPSSQGQSIAPPAVVRDHSDLFSSTETAPPKIPQIQPIRAPEHPAQLAPRNSGTHPPMRPINRAPAPYQRTGDQFSQNMYPPLGPQQPSVPPASNLPPPKLTAQASGLLNLFKSRESSGLSAADGALQNAPPNAVVLQERKISKPSPMIVPPQVPRTSSFTVPQVTTPSPAHQANLLKLFRTPPVSHGGPKSLQPPTMAVELSASPTPGHSREPSTSAEVPNQRLVTTVNPPTKPLKTQKHRQHGNATVSATISGPLNIPQFDMIGSAARDAHNSAHKGNTKVYKDSPVRIMSRPTSSHDVPPNALQPPSSQLPSQPPQQPRQLAPLATPTKTPQPPTPDLKAHTAPPKPFQPRILRRPGISHDAGEPSPIQPLPSPHVKTFKSQPPAPSADHKKSLLSLFTKSSPVVSPPSDIPSNTVDSATVISPLEYSLTQPPQSGMLPIHDVLGHFSSPGPNIPALRPQRKSSRPGKTFYAPDRMPKPSAQSIPANLPAANGNESGDSSEKPTLTRTHSSTTTPVQKEFLLGYLADVVKSGR